MANLLSLAARPIDWALKAAVRRALSKSNGQQLNSMMAANAAVGLPEFASIAEYAQQADYYTRSSWVYIAVNKVVTAAVGAKYNVFQQVGESQDEIKNHAIEQLLRRPNSDQSYYEFVESHYGFLEIAGNSYWYLAGRPGGQPEQIYLLRPDRMRVVAGRDTSRSVSGYVYDCEGKYIPLEADEVIHFKLFNPTNDYYGLSRMRAAAIGLLTDLAMERWNYLHFGRDNAMPAGAVVIKNTVSENDFSRIKREWVETYGAGGRKTAFLRGGEIDWKDMGVNHRDMEFVVGREFTMEEIFRIWGIHPGLMDKNATEANATAADANFIRDTIYPSLQRTAAKLTNDLAPFWSRDIVIEPEDIRIKDKDAENREIETASKFLSINEIREKYYKEKPVEWGNRPWTGTASYVPPEVTAPAAVPQIPANVSTTVEKPKQKTPASKPENGIELDNPQDDQADDTPPTKALLTELTQFVTKVGKRRATREAVIDTFKFNAAPLSTEIAIKAWAAVSVDNYDLALICTKGDALLTAKQRVDVDGKPDPLAHEKTRFAAQIESKFRTYLEGLRTRMISGMRSAVTSKDASNPESENILAFFNDRWWKLEFDKMASIMRPVVQAGFRDAAIETYNTLHMQIGVGLDQSVFNTDAARYALDWTDTWLKKFGTTTKDGAGELLARWIATPGATFDDLTKAFQQSELFKSGRSRLAAETEATRVFARGEYIATERVADALGAELIIDPLTYDNLIPAHPGCRCWTVTDFIYDDTGKIIAITLVWRTANDAAVCPICAPRHGVRLNAIAGAQ